MPTNHQTAVKNRLVKTVEYYLKAIQMNDISDMLYHNKSHVIDQMIDQATKSFVRKSQTFQPY